jgi:hypothetical protein
MWAIIKAIWDGIMLLKSLWDLWQSLKSAPKEERKQATRDGLRIAFRKNVGGNRRQLLTELTGRIRDRKV